MKSKEYVSIKKMIEYIEKAIRYTKDCDFNSFSKNEENSENRCRSTHTHTHTHTINLKEIKIKRSFLCVYII